eukprot:1921809-Karenia_brevis.AAC.1
MDAFKEIVERMAVLQTTGAFAPRTRGLHWCRHVYRHWNKEADAKANEAVMGRKNQEWYHPEARHM